MPAGVFRYLTCTKIHKVFFFFFVLNSLSTSSPPPVRFGLWPNHKCIWTFPGLDEKYCVTVCEQMWVRIHSCTFESSVTDVTFLYHKKNPRKCRKVGQFGGLLYPHFKGNPFEIQWKVDHVQPDIVWKTCLYHIFIQPEGNDTFKAIPVSQVWWRRVTLFQKNKYLFYFSWHPNGCYQGCLGGNIFFKLW